MSHSVNETVIHRNAHVNDMQFLSGWEVSEVEQHVALVWVRRVVEPPVQDLSRAVQHIRNSDFVDHLIRSLVVSSVFNRLRDAEHTAVERVFNKGECAVSVLV